MTVSLISQATQTGNTSGAVVVALPAGWAADDLVFISCCFSSSGGTMTAPAGWTAVPGTPVSSNVSNRVYGWYRKMVGGDANPSFTASNAQPYAFASVCYRGQHLTLGPLTPATAPSNNNSGGPQSIAADAMNYTNVKLVSVCGWPGTSSTPTLATANGFTIRSSVGTTAGTDVSVALADKDLTDAYLGATGPTWNVFGVNNTMSFTIGIVDADQRNVFRMAQASTAAVNMVGLLPSLTYGTSNSGTAATYTGLIPSEAADGDLLLLVCLGGSGGATFTTPAGWTSVAMVRESTSRRLQIFSRRFVPGDANPTGTYNAGQPWVTCVICAKNAGDIDKLLLDGLDQGNAESNTAAGSDTPLSVTNNGNKLGVSLVFGAVYLNSALSLSVAQGYTAKKELSTGAQRVLIAEKQFRDDWVTIPSPTIAAASGTGRWFNITLTIPGTLQPTRFRMVQDQTATLRAHTNFPEVIAGTVHKSSSGTAWSVPIPTSVESGDLMLLVLAGESGGGTFTTPSGWTSRASVRTNTSRRLQIFSKVYSPGDADPSGTYSSGQARIGVVLLSKYTAQADKVIQYGLDQGNPVSTTSATQHHTPDITGINDTYSYLLSVFHVASLAGNVTGLFPGDEEGQVQIFRDFNGAALFIGGRRWLGSGTAPGPSIQISAARNGTSVHIQLEGEFQPKEIAADIDQAQTMAVAIGAVEGFPIEANIVQEQVFTLRGIATKPKYKKPQRELVWVHGLDGVRKSVID